MLELITCTRHYFLARIQSHPVNQRHFSANNSAIGKVNPLRKTD